MLPAQDEAVQDVSVYVHVTVPACMLLFRG
jgi:hypothetical protein